MQEYESDPKSGKRDLDDQRYSVPSSLVEKSLEKVNMKLKPNLLFRNIEKQADWLSYPDVYILVEPGGTEKVQSSELHVYGSKVMILFPRLDLALRFVYSNQSRAKRVSRI